MATCFEKYYNDEKCVKLCYNLFAYSAPPDGYYKINGEVFYDNVDFRTVERYQEYKECGFNILHPQTSAVYSGEDFVTSKAKMVMDRSLQAGVDKVILVDERIRALSQTVGGIVGKDKPFATQAKLDAWLKECMAPYQNHPAFYGVQLKDEPTCAMFETIGQIYRSIKRIRPQTYVMCNLFPMITLHVTNRFFPGDGSLFDRFKGYLHMFLDETGADYIMYDMYPFTASVIPGEHMHRLYVKSLQLASEVCRERNVEFHFVAQSFGMLTNGHHAVRVPTTEEMVWQDNILLGFGVKQFAYYTYWNCKTQNYAGEHRHHNDSIMTWKGEKTHLYPIVQTLNKRKQMLAPVLKNFKLKGSRFYIHTPMLTHPFYLETLSQSKLEKIVGAQTDNEVAILFEHYDEEREQYLHVLQNTTYPYYAVNLRDPKQTTTVTFAPEYTKVDVFDGNEWKTYKLLNGQFTVTLLPGEAVYILPY